VSKIERGSNNRVEPGHGLCRRSGGISGGVFYEKRKGKKNIQAPARWERKEAVKLNRQTAPDSVKPMKYCNAKAFATKSHSREGNWWTDAERTEGVGERGTQLQRVRRT